MIIDGWFSGYKVHSFPWIDGKTIYFNVSYYVPGQAVSRPPVWEKTVYVTDNEEGRRVVEKFTESLACYVAKMAIPRGRHAMLTFGCKPEEALRQ